MTSRLAWFFRLKRWQRWAIVAGIVVGIVLRGDRDEEAVRGKLKVIGFGLFVPAFFVTSGLRFDLDEIKGIAEVGRAALFLVALIAIPVTAIAQEQAAPPSSAPQAAPPPMAPPTTPDEFVAHAGIGERIAFVGLGVKFQIWDPVRLESVERERIAQALARRQHNGGAA